MLPHVPNEGQADWKMLNKYNFRQFFSFFLTLMPYAPSSAQNGVRRRLHPAKPGDLGVNVVPWSWAGVYRDHYIKKQQQHTMQEPLSKETPLKK